MSVKSTASKQALQLLFAFVGQPATNAPPADAPELTEFLSTAVEMAKAGNDLDVVGEPESERLVAVTKLVTQLSEEVAPALASGEMKQMMPLVSRLNKQLESLVFLVDNQLSLADLYAAVLLAPVLKKWNVEMRQRSPNITRWLDNIQHLPLLSPVLKELKLLVTVNQTVAVIKKKAPKAPKAKGKEKGKAAGGGAGGKHKPLTEADVSIANLELRVGRIVSIKKHPNAESLYQEEIDIGEEKPRTIVSGLVKFVPIEEMEQRLVVVLCNLKAAKMRGVVSSGMVICSSNEDHSACEVVDPPKDSSPGDLISVAGVEATPFKVINLSNKNNVFGKFLQKDLTTSATGVAQYKDQPLVTSKGQLTVKSLFNGHLG